MTALKTVLPTRTEIIAAGFNEPGLFLPSILGLQKKI